MKISNRFSSFKLENNLIINSYHKNNETYGSVPYIPPEVLRGNEFTIEGDIYSFGGIMYEIVTAKQPFADQAHDTHLMTDINDPFERPSTYELSNLFRDVLNKLYGNIVDNNVMRQLKIVDENQKKNTSKSKKQELLELHSHSRKIDNSSP
ncbi:hypothetical protein Glove_527g14 [Diversispora epigaea]|uniref:Protein kinase domain-containing protein n=1 Tax=Diversispora epigaea TaxID=1348612 RepID=A0A397GML7_9GLOM|nr:hypothetical protein Glove_527g14 [Diversispora epigaea]